MSPAGSVLAEARARQTLRSSRLPFNGPLVRASSTRNEIHLSGAHVVRVSTKLDQRLRREAALYGYLPDEPWLPTLAASGEQAGINFVIVDRKPGEPLAHAWPQLDPDRRRRAISRLATWLQTLHRTRAPSAEELAPLDLTTHLVDEAAASAGRVTPLEQGLRRLAEDARADSGVVRAALDLVSDTGWTLDELDTEYLVHGDLTFENILIDGGQLSALVDFEWSRGAPPEIDLDVLLRCCALPAAHVADRHRAATRAEDYAPVPGWLAADYPALFDRPHLAERLTLYALAYDVRDALEQPVPTNRGRFDPLHPYNRLVNLVSTGGYVAELLDRVGVAG